MSKVGNNWPKYLRGALIAAFMIGMSLYLADHSHPALAGLFAAIPVALPTMILLEDSQVKDYAFSLALGIGSYVIAAFFFYYLYTKEKWVRWKALLTSMVLWIFLACLAYYLFTNGPFSANGK
jgi:ABC-type cobalamin transport system permease subunit